MCRRRTAYRRWRRCRTPGDVERRHWGWPGRVATVFFVSLSTPLNLLSDCRRARCGQGQAASRWPLAILDLRCARRRGRGQVGTKERSGFDRTKERGIARWLSAGFPVAFVAHHGVEDHE